MYTIYIKKGQIYHKSTKVVETTQKIWHTSPIYNFKKYICIQIIIFRSIVISDN